MQKKWEIFSQSKTPNKWLKSMNCSYMQTKLTAKKIYYEKGKGEIRKLF